jgi:hypothetical protein
MAEPKDTAATGAQMNKVSTTSTIQCVQYMQLRLTYQRFAHV